MQRKKSLATALAKNNEDDVQSLSQLGSIAGLNGGISNGAAVINEKPINVNSNANTNATNNNVNNVNNSNTNNNTNTTSANNNSNSPTTKGVYIFKDGSRYEGSVRDLNNNTDPIALANNALNNGGQGAGGESATPAPQPATSSKKEKEKEKDANAANANASTFVPSVSMAGFHRHGFGTFSNSLLTYSGDWVMDKMNGTGKITFSDGSSYEGEWKDNSFEGVGKYTWSDGSYYIGEWKDNRIQGSGNFTSKNGEVWMGVFDNGASRNLELVFQ